MDVNGFMTGGMDIEKLCYCLEILEVYHYGTGVTMINKKFIKRRYFDMRLGGTQVSPIIQLLNFTMITFLWINHIIPVEVFAPIFLILGFIALSYVGVRFRKHQATTDHTMIFEKQQMLGKSFYIIAKAIKENKFDKEFDEHLEYLKKIGDAKV